MVRKHGKRNRHNQSAHNYLQGTTIMKAVVLAGGLGTRLRGRVSDIPKVMAPVAGRPFLEFVLDRLVSAEINKIILSVGYLADIIIKHFGNTYHGTEITYALEKEPLGTGGAIQHALREEKEPALVLNGDTLLDLDYQVLIEWYWRSPSTIAMVLKSVNDVERFGAVIIEGDRVIRFEEKRHKGSGLINAGVYIVDPAIFATFRLQGAFSFESDLIQRHCSTLQPRAYITDGYFIDIGIPKDFDRAQRELW